MPDVVELYERHRYVESSTSAKQVAESEAEDADVTEDDEEDPDDSDDSEADDWRVEGRREIVVMTPARITAVRTNAVLFRNSCEVLHLYWRGLWSLL